MINLKMILYNIFGKTDADKIPFFNFDRLISKYETVKYIQKSE